VKRLLFLWKDDKIVVRQPMLKTRQTERGGEVEKNNFPFYVVGIVEHVYKGMCVRVCLFLCLCVWWLVLGGKYK
jgi:hypothetical protein